MADPPVLAGAVQRTVAEALPAVGAPIVGAPGAVAVVPAVGVTAVDLAEAVPVPAALVAATSKVYAVPLVNPAMVVLVTLPTVVVGPTCVVPEKFRTL